MRQQPAAARAHDGMLVAFAFCSYAWREGRAPLSCATKGLPGHPFVRYRVSKDNSDLSWVICSCSHCGDEWRRGCSRDARVNKWVFRYAVLHGHGYHPVLKP